MGLVRLSTTSTVLEPTDLREHLRIDGVSDDAAIDALHRAAVDYVERATRTQIGQGTFRLTLDRFPAGRVIRLPAPPLAAVGSVTFIDPGGSAVTLDPSAYHVDASSLPGRIVLRDGHSWPSTANEPAAVRIEFSAGHEAGQVPETLRHLLRLLVGAYFEHREGISDRRLNELPVPFAVTALINQHAFPEAP